MHHPDLPPGVLDGLAWYYLLAALINAAAAAYVAYGEMVSEGASRVGLAPKTRRLPDWLVLTFGGLLAGAAVLILGRSFVPDALQIAYFLCAAATATLAIAAGADAAHHAEVHAAGHGHEAPVIGPTLDDHQPAVGIGGPINRTLWTLIWGVAAVFFQAIGLTYILGGAVALPEFVRDGVDAAAGPVSFFVLATLGFAALIAFRRTLSSGLVAWAIVNVSLLLFGLSMTDYDFRAIVTKPDNVPIVGMMVLVGFFTWLAMRRAVINDSRMARGLPNLEETQPEKTLTWPDLVYTELICMVGLTVVLIVWAVVLKAPLEEPASSTVAPNPSKAPWYFLGLQEMLVYYDPWIAGVLLPTFIIIGLMAIPYIDTNKTGNGYYTIEQRKFAYVTFQFGYLVLWVLLIILGTFLRGPNWNFFGPYEYWDPHKLIPLNNVNLSDMVWINWLGTALPENIVLRELTGILMVLAYFVVLPPMLGRLAFRRYIEEAGMLRYIVLATLILFMASLPIKMVLRWTLNLKYLVAIPEFFFNI